MCGWFPLEKCESCGFEAILRYGGSPWLLAIYGMKGSLFVSSRYSLAFWGRGDDQGRRGGEGGGDRENGREHVQCLSVPLIPAAETY